MAAFFCAGGAFPPRSGASVWMFCAGGVFFHGIRLMHGCFVPAGENRYLSGRRVAYVAENYYIVVNCKTDADEKICFYGSGFVACRYCECPGYSAEV